MSFANSEFASLVAADYQQLLAVGDAVLPGPLTELTVGWRSQEDGIKQWSPCEKESIKELTLTLALIPYQIFWLRLPEK